MHKIPKFVAIAASIKLTAALAMAQVTYSTITGTVTNPNGRPLAGATITATLVTMQGIPVSGLAAPNGAPYNGSPVYGTLDPNGHFSIGLVPNATLEKTGSQPLATQWSIAIGAPQEPTSLALASAQSETYRFIVTGPQDISSQLSALITQNVDPSGPQSSGMGLLTSSQSGTGSNNIANFFGSTSNCNGASKPCIEVVDPSYAVNEHYNWSNQATPNLSMGASQALLEDFRGGNFMVVSHDPSFNPHGIGMATAMGLLCNNTTGLYATIACLRLNMAQSAPGVSFGNPGLGPQGWSVSSGVSLLKSTNTTGISQTISLFHTKSGIGDAAGIYNHMWGYGGATAPSDEGLEVAAFQGGENPLTFAGRISMGGTAATSVKVNCTTDCGNQGGGRYLIDTQAPIATGSITGTTSPSEYTPGTLTISSTVPVSTFWGRLNADLATPVGAPVGAGSTAMTFAVTKLGGASAPAAGDLLCFNGMFHEQARVSSVTGSGPYTITANLRHAHPSGSWVMDGGACGMFVDMMASHQTPKGQTLRYPIDVIGSTSANTLVFAYFAYGYGGWPFGWGMAAPSTQPISNLTNTNGLVAFKMVGGHADAYLGGKVTSIYISNASDSSFNGSCTSLYQNLNSAGVVFYCSQASSSDHIAASARIAFGNTAWGNTGFNLYAGAEVLDVQNESLSPPSIDGTLMLEPNAANWNVNDTVEEPHHYAARDSLEFDNLFIYNPTGKDSNGITINLFGAGISGGVHWSPASFAGLRLDNLNSPSIYAKHGGTINSPGGYSLQGQWRYGLQMDHPPDATLVYVAGSNPDPTQPYGLFWTENSQPINYNPVQRSLWLASGSPLHFPSPIDGPVVAGSVLFGNVSAPQNNGSHANTGGGSLADNTTYYYYVVAQGNTYEAWSLRSSEFTVTTGSSGGKNSIYLLWTRPPGATGYAVCRGTRSGSEQVIFLNPGGFNGEATYFVDTGAGTSGGACPGERDSSLGGVEQARHIGINSPGTNYEATISAPVGYKENQNYTIAGSGPGIVTGPTTGVTSGHPVCYIGTAGQTQDCGVALPSAPLSGTTGNIGGSALTVGQCASGAATVTGATTSMVVQASPQAYPGDGFNWLAYVSASNTVRVKVCAIVAGTPVAAAYNVRVQ
jgi:hypothetical protein